MKRLLLVVALLVVLPGCIFGNKHPIMAEAWPVYKIPDGPKLNLPDTIVPGKNPEVDLLIKNLYDTKSYAETLKIMLSTHNASAEMHNAQVDAALGVNKKK